MYLWSFLLDFKTYKALAVYGFLFVIPLIIYIFYSNKGKGLILMSCYDRYEDYLYLKLLRKLKTFVFGADS